MEYHHNSAQVAHKSLPVLQSMAKTGRRNVLLRRSVTGIQILKRIFDLLLSIVILIPALPVMAVVAIAIRRTSEGPAIFVQERVGLNEKVFKCLKFRTMAHGTPDIASHQASTSWITPLGRMLRKTKIDELPQLFNVISGDMSLVGPRPCLPNQTELIMERRRLGVFSVRPGVTGLAQVAGVDMSDPIRLAALDSQYVASRTLMGDLKLIVRTGLGSGSGDVVSKS